MDKRPKLSVLVATKNRPASLARLLQALEDCGSREFIYEVIVVSNGSNEEDRKVLDVQRKNYTLIPLYQPRAGRSRALNAGLDVVSGDLVAFTDDDTVPAQSWLRSIYSASLRYPRTDIFCGPIVPQYPSEVPEWLRYHRYADAMFARFEPELPESKLPIGMLPFGANFATRAPTVEGVRFSMELGASDENGPLLGEDVEFVERLRSKGSEIVFLPDAYVLHMIVPQRGESDVIFRRAFHMGRTMVLIDGKPTLNQMPVIPEEEEMRDLVVAFERGSLLNYYCGQLCECRSRSQTKYESEVWRVLHQLDIESNLASLCPEARDQVSYALEDLPSFNATTTGVL